MASIGTDMKKSGPLYTVGVNIILHSHSTKQYGGSSKQIHI